MRAILLTSLIALAVLGATRTNAQQPEFTQESAQHRVSFSFDPVHGVIQATPRGGYEISGKMDPALAETTPTSKTYTGTIDIIFTVKLISTLAKGTLLRCSGNAGLEYESVQQVTPTFGVGFGGFLSSSENVSATVSGSTATCKFTIPYSWTVPPSTASTTVTIRGITGSVGISAVLPETTGTVTTNTVIRSTSVELLGPVQIPPDGTTTTLTPSAVL